MKIDRRKFIKASTLAALSASGALTLGCSDDTLSSHPDAPQILDKPPAPTIRGLVARAHDDEVRVKGEEFKQDKVTALLDRAVMRITNQDQADLAWKELFSPNDIVGLKLNCLGGRRISSHPVVAQAIVEGLRKAGVTDDRIIIWERFDRELQLAGYKVQKKTGLLRVMATEGEYDKEITMSGETGSCYTPFVSRLCTAQVNVPVLKDHSFSGVSIGMKNFFGAIHNPNKYHPTSRDPHCCDPFVADVCNCPLIRDKLRLVVCDALNGQYDGGPTLKASCLWEENSLLAATDPVALDTVGWGLIEEQRKLHGLKTLQAAGRPPKWLATANGYGLGENDPLKIETVEV